MATHSSILAWRIPWTEELAVYSPWDHKESDATYRLTLTGSSSDEWNGRPISLFFQTLEKSSREELVSSDLEKRWHWKSSQEEEIFPQKRNQLATPRVKKQEGPQEKEEIVLQGGASHQWI